MKNEDLLKPRYKVIADYPGGDLPIGGVLARHKIISDWLNLVDAEHGLIGIKESYVDKYPHLFKKLEWWQERLPEDLPEYVSAYRNGKKHFYKVDSWHYSPTLETMLTDTYLSAKDCTPATREQYETQLTHA